MSRMLKLEDYIELSDEGYEGVIVEFLHDNGIAVDDFEQVGRCDSECLECEAENFRVWHKKLGFIEDQRNFTLDLKAADDILDFAIYLCNQCGKWTIYVE